MSIYTRCITFQDWISMSEIDRKVMLRANREGRVKLVGLSKDLTMMFFDILPPKRKESNDPNR